LVALVALVALAYVSVKRASLHALMLYGSSGSWTRPGHSALSATTIASLKGFSNSIRTLKPTHSS
jgi:hypothetical protein